MKRLIHGRTWIVHGPALYELAGYLAYDGFAWYLAFAGDYDGARPWPSRDSAAAAIADAFTAHQIQESIR